MRCDHVAPSTEAARTESRGGSSPNKLDLRTDPRRPCALAEALDCARLRATIGVRVNSLLSLNQSAGQPVSQPMPGGVHPVRALCRTRNCILEAYGPRSESGTGRGATRAMASKDGCGCTGRALCRRVSLTLPRHGGPFMGNLPFVLCIGLRQRLRRLDHQWRLCSTSRRRTLLHAAYALVLGSADAGFCPQTMFDAVKHALETSPCLGIGP